MSATAESLRTLGAREGESGIVWLATQCRNNNVRLESLVRQAENARDPELADFFRRTKAISEGLAAA